MNVGDVIKCACGCGGIIIIKKDHKYKGIPKFINHHFRKYLSVEEKRKAKKESKKRYLLNNKERIKILKRNQSIKHRDRIKTYMREYRKRLFIKEKSRQDFYENTCSCGCGGLIRKRNIHKYSYIGAPRFLPGHASRVSFNNKNNPNWKGGIPPQEIARRCREKLKTNNYKEYERRQIKSQAQSWFKYITGESSKNMPIDLLKSKVKLIEINRKIKKEKENGKD